MGLEEDHAVRLWEVGTGRLRGLLRGHDGLVRAVAFSPDGSALASASWDRTVRIWDVASGGALATLRGHRASVVSLAFAPDGTSLASGGMDGDIRLWDVDIARGRFAPSPAPGVAVGRRPKPALPEAGGGPDG